MSKRIKKLLKKEVKKQTKQDITFLKELVNLFKKTDYKTLLKKVHQFFGMKVKTDEKLIEVFEDIRKTELKKLGKKKEKKVDVRETTFQKMYGELSEYEQKIFKKSRYMYDYKEEYKYLKPLMDICKKFSDVEKRKIIEIDTFGLSFCSLEDFFKTGEGVVLFKNGDVEFCTNYDFNVPKDKYLSIKEDSYYSSKKDRRITLFYTDHETFEVKIVLREGKIKVEEGSVKEHYHRYDEGGFNEGIPKEFYHFCGIRSEQGRMVMLKSFIFSEELDMIKAFVKHFGGSLLNEFLREDSFHNHGQTPILFYVLQAKNLNMDIIKYFFEHPEIKLDCEYSWYGSGNSSNVPLCMQISRCLSNTEAHVEIGKYLFSLKGIDIEKREISSRRYSGTVKTHLIESLIRKNNYELAKYLIETRGINYFHINDLNLGENRIRGRRRGKRRSSLGSEEKKEPNKTYKYVMMKRNLWNSYNFKFFSKEYQNAVVTFCLCVKKLELHLPHEMIYEIFQNIDYFDFKFIAGKKRKNKKGEVVNVWDENPKCRRNEKLYYSHVDKIKEECTKIFGVNDIEFKVIVENYHKFETRVDNLLHFSLINMAFYIKQDIFKVGISDTVGSLMEIVKKKRKEEIKHIQGRLDEEKKNEGSWYYRRRREKINWLNKETMLKYYKIPEKVIKDEELKQILNKFVNFVKDLK